MTEFRSRRGGRGMAVLTRLLRIAVVLVSIVALAGCTSGPGVAAPTATSTTLTGGPTPSVSSNPGRGAASALDAYRGMWKAYVAAIHIPDPAYPDLARFTQGDALKVFVNGLTSVQRDGLVGQGDVTLNPSVAVVNPNATPGPTVEITDCVDTSQSHLVKKDGSPYQDAPGGRCSAKATVTRLTDGTWKVTSFGLQTVGSC